MTDTTIATTLASETFRTISAPAGPGSAKPPNAARAKKMIDIGMGAAIHAETVAVNPARAGQGLAGRCENAALGTGRPRLQLSFHFRLR